MPDGPRAGPAPGLVEPPLQGPFLVDGHAHLHGCFDRSVFFDRAAANFRAAAGALELPVVPLGCLALTDGPGRDTFGELSRPGFEGTARWQAQHTAEAESLFVVGRGGERLLVLAGRQIPTRRGLEVLALGTRVEFAAGGPLRETVELVLAAGALAVVPWGFGKWWWGRGREVAELLASPPSGLCLGDNGGRPRVGIRPRLFAQAMNQRIPILPGSDPLPFPRQVGVAGAHGFVLGGELSTDRPAAGVLRLVRSLTEQPPTYGRGERLLPFARNQLAMQVQGRRRLRA